jgi:hypothetical protein
VDIKLKSMTQLAALGRMVSPSAYMASSKAYGDWHVSNVGENRHGSNVPRGFQPELAGRSYRLTPNATKHTDEYLRNPQRAGSLTGFPLSPLIRAIEKAMESDLTIGRYENIFVDEWQLGVEIKESETVIFHANFKRSGW